MRLLSKIILIFKLLLNNRKFVFLFNKVVLNKTVILNYDIGRNNDFYYPLYKILKEKNIKVYLLCQALSQEWYWDERFDRSDIFTRFQLNFRYSLKSNCSFVSTGGFPKTPDSNFFSFYQINHGFGSLGAALNKNYFKSPENTFFIANTNFQVQQLENEFSYLINPKNILPYGYPKLDGYCINPGSLGGSELKTIFYGPTYHREISSIFKFINPLIKYCIKNDIVLYVKLHPMLYEYYDSIKSGGVDWVEFFNKIDHENIILLDKHVKFSNVSEIFLKTDLFLSDSSGLGFEFPLITGKPAGNLGKGLKIPLDKLKANEIEGFKQYPEFYYRGKLGPEIIVPENLEKYLNDFNQEDYQVNLLKFRSEFTFNLNCASEKISEHIISNLANGN